MAWSICYALLILSHVTLSLACFCDRYPWGPWSPCSRTCNYGIQSRARALRFDDYYWKSSCPQLCQIQQSRACNEHGCPINCILTEFDEWSNCSSCASKQLRTRSIEQPSQFGGAECSVELTEDRPCYPSKECKLPPLNCGDKFKCDNDRCINATLTCNRQDDCGDSTDERNCHDYKVVCPVDKAPAPGSGLVGNGFDVLAEEPRAAVLDNTFMGADCTIRRPKSSLLYHRVPYNFESFEIKVDVPEDFKPNVQDVHTETINVHTASSSTSRGPSYDNFLFLFFYAGGSSGSSFGSYSEVFKAAKKKDSKFIRVFHTLPVSKFKVRDSGDLVLSLPFLRFLYDLPLEYNYPLYKDIFQRFGTHYYSSGTLGGKYDLVYQYSREELTTSGDTEEHTKNCLGKETFFTVILYTQSSSVTRCSDNKMTQKYEGSYIQSSEKSFSFVKGGQAREAAALAWERSGPVPDRDSYKNWAKSVIDNPAVVDYELRSIIDLVKGIPCAVTKRTHLQKALLQYLEEFDPCRCAPCPNNARPVLSGTECKCICQIGTYGTNCETRAPDYTSEAVDGYWSCWSQWSECRAAMKRHRTRRCDNPAPMRGGRSCQGLDKQVKPCDVSIFEKQESCDNDDDFTQGWRDELPPGVEGCLRPKRPANSYLTKARSYYDYGESEEFRCFTGFELEGFQYINCLSGGTWSQPKGRCIRKVCFPPEIPKGMTLSATRQEYRVGKTVGLNCDEPGLAPLPRGIYKCSERLTWEPALPTDLRCTDENPFVIESRCGPGMKRQGSQCVCIERESCLSYQQELCILNVDIDVSVPMSICSFQAGRCHGDPIFFVSKGSCNETKVEWARFRAKMASRSSVQKPCDIDTCFEWETCSASKQCECKSVRDCPRGEEHMLCVKTIRTQRTRSMSVCAMAALVCLKYDLEIVHEGRCE